MTMFVTAIYKDGKLQLLEPLPLAENEKVSLIVSTPPTEKKLPPSDFGALYGIWRGLGDQLIEGVEAARHETNAKLERIARELDESYHTTDTSNE